MGEAKRRLEERRQTLALLRQLSQNKENVLVIHYSCESFSQSGGKSSRIISISVRSLKSGQTHSFSIHQVAERRSIPLEEMDSHFDEFEKVLLDEFYQFVASHTGYRWLHWNMISVNFGFPALAHRYQVLNGNPNQIPESQLIDLSACLKSIYGRHYVGPSRFNTVVELNNLRTSHLLTGSEEALAIAQKNYVKPHQSTQTKVYVLSEIFQLTVDNKLKTHLKRFELARWGLQASVEQIKEHWIISLLGLVALIGAILKLFKVIG